ncbi:unannotated protein [freshwater metagenome]|uniref:Unannotated protein n=1 Tax=freshwater metagenome TaxID=449393 RepID=A0A6J6Q8F5_9ZZZZ|nr:hypothetical protein [Actinomycetota bacterium]MSW24726.1 hypothetical protein [Actinomycetota bacterium]MSX28944.1 hypothetical protein [Actinomycetota bacterium]MSX42816.1 hypothetical protein [Actinomycetota bacterium]MSX96679.1 hypothetical protein [Actinomycetota bacterium]
MDSDNGAREIDNYSKEIFKIENEKEDWKFRAIRAEQKLEIILDSPAWRISKPIRVINLLYWKFRSAEYRHSQSKFEIVKEGPTVIEEARGRVTIECENSKLEASRVALVAHWSIQPNISTSLEKLILELLNNDYEVILISACESPNKLVSSPKLTERITIIRKPNLGYDFGSWALGNEYLKNFSGVREVILVNDSCAGPFGKLGETLSRLSDAPFDVTGITDSLQFRFHLQSYFIHFKNGSFYNHGIQDFLRDVRIQPSKNSVIAAYELGLSAIAMENGFLVGALYPWNIVSQYWKNPSVTGWKNLLELGHPFIKREVVRKLKVTQKKELIAFLANHFSISDSEIELLLESPN